MTQFGEKCKKKFFALLNIVGFIVAFIVEFNMTLLKTFSATNLDTLIGNQASDWLTKTIAHDPALGQVFSLNGHFHFQFSNWPEFFITI